MSHAVDTRVAHTGCCALLGMTIMTSSMSTMVFVRTVRPPPERRRYRSCGPGGVPAQSNTFGSANDEVELGALKTAATAALAAGQTELDLGLSQGVQPGTLPITSSRMSHLWDALCAAYQKV